MRYRKSESLRNILDGDLNKHSEYSVDNISQHSRNVWGLENAVISGCAVNSFNSGSYITVDSGYCIISGLPVYVTGTISGSISGFASGFYNIYGNKSTEYYDSRNTKFYYDVSTRATGAFYNYRRKRDTLTLTITTGSSTGILFGQAGWNGETFTSTTSTGVAGNIYNSITGFLGVTVPANTGTLVSSISSLSGVQNTRINTLTGQIATLSGNINVLYGSSSFSSSGNASYAYPGSATGLNTLASFSVAATTGFTNIDFSVYSPYYVRGASAGNLQDLYILIDVDGTTVSSGGFTKFLGGASSYSSETYNGLISMTCAYCIANNSSSKTVTLKAFVPFNSSNSIFYNYSACRTTL